MAAPHEVNGREPGTDQDGSVAILFPPTEHTVTTTANMPGRARGSRVSSKQTEWLPSQRDRLLLLQPLNMRYIKAEKNHDWFLTLSYAMRESDDTQARMLAKAYLFLRDFMPRGLAGPYAHISGNELMRYLCCHPGEIAMSRHKLAKEAEKAFDDLTRWRGNATSWKHALSQSGRLSAGLYSPAALLALLVIAYPEPKFKDLISRLRIQWMLSPLAELDETEGFWKGLNSANVNEAFVEDQPRRLGSCKLSLDYDSIFGKDFLRCRVNMQPFLPSWAQRLTLNGSPNLDGMPEFQDLTLPDHDNEDTDAAVRRAQNQDHMVAGDSTCEEEGTVDTGSIAHGPDDIMDTEDTGHGDGSQTSALTTPSTAGTWQSDHLRTMLLSTATPAKSPSKLEIWLIGKVFDGNEFYVAWCNSWAHKMQSAENHGEQLLIRSLFVQSLFRLEGLHTCSTFSEPEDAVAYMLVDQENTEPPSEHVVNAKAKALLKAWSPYKAWSEQSARLSRRVRGADGRLSELLERITTQRAAFFNRLLSEESLASYASNVISFERRVVQSLVDYLESLEAGPAPPKAPWRDILLDSKSAAELKLTTWQLYSLMAGSDPKMVLTDCQHRLGLREPLIGELEFVDLSRVSPVPLERIDTPETDEKGNHILRQLFGSIDGRGESQVSQISATTQYPSTAHSMHTMTSWATEALQTSEITTPVASRRPSVAGRGSTNPPISPATRVQPAVGVSMQTTPAGVALQPSSRRQLTESNPGRSSSTAPPPTTASGVVVSTSRVPASTSGLFARAAAQKFTAKKRSRSSEPESSNKSPRMGEIIREVLREDLRDGAERLREELQARLTADRERLETALGAQVAAGTEQLRSGLAAELRVDMGELRTVITRDVTQRLIDESTEIMKISAQAAEAARTAEKGVARIGLDLARLESQFQVIAERLLVVDEPKTPKLGEDGFLGQFCPPPSGMDQKLYEMRLLRAGWFYINELDDPDGGVMLDGDAVVKTAGRYPDIPEEHLDLALQHVHMLAYGCAMLESTDASTDEL